MKTITNIIPALATFALVCLAFPQSSHAACSEICDANSNTAVGGGALGSNTTGSDNTAMGNGALIQNTATSRNTGIGAFALEQNNGIDPNNRANDNTATGYEALMFNFSGTQNTATGSQALRGNTSSGSTGDNNTATGFKALFSNSSGGENTATGAGALQSNTTVSGISGNFNTATGFLALFSNTTGSDNTANGLSALHSNSTGNDNTGNGVDALFNNTTGKNNTANGFEALFSNTGGSNNTAEGYGALVKSTGSNNIALGASAGTNLTTGSNNIDIGAPGLAGEANTTRIGLAKTTKTFISGVRGTTTVNANAIPVVIDSAGQLGTASSSERFKKEVKPMEKASEAILALKPVTFHYKSDSTNTPQFGLIAEEVAKVDPDLVVRDDNGEIYTVRYDAVNAMLLNEFLKEHHKVEALQSELASVKAQLKEQASQIQRVAAELEANTAKPRLANNE